jgi:hypothetical protein
MKIRPAETSCCVLTERRAHITKLIFAFRNSSKAHKTESEMTLSALDRWYISPTCARGNVTFPTTAGLNLSAVPSPSSVVLLHPHDVTLKLVSWRHNINWKQERLAVWEAASILICGSLLVFPEGSKVDKDKRQSVHLLSTSIFQPRTFQLNTRVPFNRRRRSATLRYYLGSYHPEEARQPTTNLNDDSELGVFQIPSRSSTGFNWWKKETSRNWTGSKRRN